VVWARPPEFVAETYSGLTGVQVAARERVGLKLAKLDDAFV
jgi:hypothetical protein